jgi:hypothetical protein
MSHPVRLMVPDAAEPVVDLDDNYSVLALRRSVKIHAPVEGEEVAGQRAKEVDGQSHRPGRLRRGPVRPRRCNSLLGRPTREADHPGIRQNDR